MKTKHKILIVDDNEDLCRNLGDILEMKDYEVFKAYDGYHAIENIKSARFSIVILDVRMPGINGLDTLKILKTIDPSIGVIMITAFADGIIADAKLKLENCKIIQKPIDMDKLISTIEEIIKAKNNHDIHGGINTPH